MNDGYTRGYTEQARRFEERVIEEVYHRGNLDVIDALYDPGYISHHSGGPAGGRHKPPAEVKGSARATREAFPDLRVEIGHFMAVGGEDSAEISYYYTITGTHRGHIQGLAPTGRRVSTSGMCMGRMAGGKYVEGWDVADGLHLARQLGLSLQRHKPSRPRHRSTPPAAGSAASGSSSWRQHDGWSNLSLLAALGLGWMIGDE